MFSFENKNVLLIGGGQNIGRAIALEFAERGAAVAIADISADGARETAQMILDAGGKAMGMGCNVMQEESLAEAVKIAQEFLGGIDVHMNNAGIIHLGNPEDFPVAEWERMFSVNFFGAVRANAAVLPGMLERGQGYIVNTASFAGLYPYATNRIPYAASKAALVSMSENMAIYLKPKGILVSCLCPGPTMTTSTKGLKAWSDNVIHRGPGSDLPVMSQRDVARVLADGMCAELPIILTHEGGAKYVRQRGDSPNDFIDNTVAAFGRGDSGLPRP